MSLTNCPKCSVRLVGGANFCHHCGAGVAEDPLGWLPRADDAEGMSSAPPVLDTIRDDPSPAHDAAQSTGESGRDAPEHDVWQGGFSPMFLIGGFILSILITAGCLGAIALAAVQHSMFWVWVSAVVLAVVWVTQLARVTPQWLGTRYRLTDRRLLRQTGLLNCHKDQLELARVEDVRVRQSVLHRLVDVGSVEILSSDRRLRRLVMDGIRHADDRAEQIRYLSGRLRESTGRIAQQAAGR